MAAPHSQVSNSASDYCRLKQTFKLRNCKGRKVLSLAFLSPSFVSKGSYSFGVFCTENSSLLPFCLFFLLFKQLFSLFPFLFLIPFNICLLFHQCSPADLSTLSPTVFLLPDVFLLLLFLILSIFLCFCSLI